MSPDPAHHLPDDPLRGTAYRAVERIGRGGMGDVYEAEHMELGRRVVVKLLHPEIADDPRHVARLRLEARTLAALAHPNVVAVSDYGCTPSGRPYLVMERLYGRTLRQLLTERGALPVAEAIGYVRQILAGLGAAHELGVVHRDVKADNVFLCAPAADTEGAACSPVVKVLDFGIAKVLQGAGARVTAPQHPTKEGTLLGSLRWLAPEQALCLPVDARTDLYSVGVLLYTLLVGQGPFPDARDPIAMLEAHVNELPPPPSGRAKQPIAPALDRAVLKALSKQPELRFQTAAQFADELRGIACSLVDADLAPSSVTPTLLSEGGASNEAETQILPPAAPRAPAKTPVAWPSPRERAGSAALFVSLMLASAAFFFALALRLLLGGR
jgi:eukaryotic-like serine/threonine-protein kinase